MTKTLSAKNRDYNTVYVSAKKFIMSKKSQEILTKAASTYRESLRKNLEHRLEAARNQGNDKLVRQLEAEANYLHIN